jgi:dihydroxyacid dehydratase/phosphogluconate dehydratase
VVEDGDEILIDAENNSLELIVEQSIIDERLSNWRPDLASLANLASTPLV